MEPLSIITLTLVGGWVVADLVHVAWILKTSPEAEEYAG